MLYRICVCALALRCANVKYMRRNCIVGRQNAFQCKFDKATNASGMQFCIHIYCLDYNFNIAIEFKNDPSTVFDSDVFKRVSNVFHANNCDKKSANGKRVINALFTSVCLFRKINIIKIRNEYQGHVSLFILLCAKIQKILQYLHILFFKQSLLF